VTDRAEPFYEDEQVTLYCGDARRMGEIDTDAIDLIVTSPPYWSIKNYRHRGQIGLGQSYGEYLEQLQVVAAEIARVLRPGRFLCWVIGTHVSDGELKHIPAESIRIFGELGLLLRKEFVWTKPKGTQGLWQRGTTQFLKDKPYPGQANINIQHEFILILQKPGEFPQQAEHRLDEAFIKSVAWSVWELPVSQVKGHPAPFPVELPARLIQLFSCPGDLVLDPFAGTGTTLIAARQLGRRALGYDISEEFCELATVLLRDESRQLRLGES
jgi:DNA modification methylase